MLINVFVTVLPLTDYLISSKISARVKYFVKGQLGTYWMKLHLARCHSCCVTLTMRPRGHEWMLAWYTQQLSSLALFQLDGHSWSSQNRFASAASLDAKGSMDTSSVSHWATVLSNYNLTTPTRNYYKPSQRKKKCNVDQQDCFVSFSWSPQWLNICRWHSERINWFILISMPVPVQTSFCVCGNLASQPLVSNLVWEGPLLWHPPSTPDILVTENWLNLTPAGSTSNYWRG